LYDTLSARLARLQGAGGAAALASRLVGLEREALRVAPDGLIAQTPHPVALGAALTHPHITTDYAESLLEIVTPAFHDSRSALAFLDDTQRFICAELGEELLWATSMPCQVAGEANIPVARYGSSNAARMKHVYRLGLGHRYGRMMQIIAGVHFNFSFGDDFWQLLAELDGTALPRRDFISAQYFALIRNLQRVGWLVPYLFGSSPVVCKSFFEAQPDALLEFNPSSYYEPWATSLRMSDIGYQNSRVCQAGTKAVYNSLDEYVETLQYAISTPCPAYEKITASGEWHQLSPNILQIENEYYATTRPKQIPAGFEMPSLALQRRGVAYVELRSLDVDAFDPRGVSAETLCFLETLMLFCLLADSPLIDHDDRESIDYNLGVVAHRGREEGLRLARGGGEVVMADWAGAIIDGMLGCAELLDQSGGGGRYRDALELQREKFDNPGLTPSAMQLGALRSSGESFSDYAMRLAGEHRKHYAARPLDAARSAEFRAMAETSHAAQREIEAADSGSFEDFLAGYFAQLERS